MATYLPDVAYAKQELTRLHSIRAKLANDIIELKTTHQGWKSADTWIHLYQSRLKENVLPAIKECEDFLHSQA